MLGNVNFTMYWQWGRYRTRYVGRPYLPRAWTLEPGIRVVPCGTSHIRVYRNLHNVPNV